MIILIQFYTDLGSYSKIILLLYYIMWRKRQALASDQQSWRGMGVDSALWTSIDRNAGNVKTALGGNDPATTTTGIVTGLSFYNNAGIAGYAAQPNDRTIFVSDASNVLITPAAATSNNTGIIQYDGSMNCTGSGLVFSVAAFGSPPAVGQDISGVQYAIINGGSGYTVGNTFGMGNLSPFNVAGASTDVLVTITSVTSTDPVQPRN